MCLVVLSIAPQADDPLIIAANRDEFYDRPTEPLAFWAETPHVLAGRDRRGGGTWMGVTRSGRIAVLTNYRDPSAVAQNAPSRGLLVKGFLTGTESPRDYLQHVQESADRYNPFNLLLGHRFAMHYYSNRTNEVLPLKPGLYGLSNSLLDTPWPKVQKGKQLLESLIRTHRRILPEDLLRILTDGSFPPAGLLPDTGVGPEWERLLSPIFIRSPRYGTRTSTALILHRSGRVTIAERTFPGPNDALRVPLTRTFRLMLAADPAQIDDPKGLPRFRP